MALNPQYMISPSLQEYFVDKTSGLPLAGGTVSFYKDNARSTLKQVFTLTGGVGAYVYTPIINPVVLSAVGTPTDGFNNDIVIYLYPYDADGNIELYYVVVKDADGVPQFTRQAWPNLVDITESNNYAYNFVRNWQFYSWSGTTVSNNVKTGSPSPTDYLVDDWSYIQNDSTQTINIFQGIYTLGDNSVPTNSPFYLIYQNTGTGSSIGTFNVFRQYYQSVETLQGQNVSVEIWVRRMSGIGDMSVSFTQYFGTGGLTPSADVETTILTIGTPTGFGTWIRYIGTGLIPSTTGKTRGTNLDDALILNIDMPLNQVGLIHIGSIRVEQGTTVSGSQEVSNDTMQQETNWWALYPPFSTGDVKSTYKSVADPGWLLMNDGTFGKPGSGSTVTGFALYYLYDLIWQIGKIHPTYLPIFTSTGTGTTYGTTSTDDWDALKRLSLPKALGRVLSGAGGFTFASAFSADDSVETLTVDDASFFLTGTAVTVSSTGTLPNPLLAATTYYSIYVDPTTIKLASTLADALSDTPINLTTNGIGDNTVTVLSTVWNLAQFTGYEGKIVDLNQTPDHQHDAPLGGNFLISGTGTAGALSGSELRESGITANIHNYTGPQQPFVVMQPTVFVNYMIKI